MGDLTKNLSRHEFACRCGCGFDTVDFMLITDLQWLVDIYAAENPGSKVSVIITGPNRCPTHNTAEGGAPGSTHPEAKAADFKIYIDGVQVDPDDVADRLDKKYPNSRGIGRYVNRTHHDVRVVRARWDTRR